MLDPIKYDMDDVEVVVGRKSDLYFLNRRKLTSSQIANRIQNALKAVHHYKGDRPKIKVEISNHWTSIFIPTHYGPDVSLAVMAIAIELNGLAITGNPKFPQYICDINEDLIEGEIIPCNRVDIQIGWGDMA